MAVNSRLRYKSLACLDCPAGVGEPCLTADGVPKAHVHTSRQRRVIRAANAARPALEAAETTAAALKVTGAGRGPVVDCPECGCSCRTSTAAWSGGPPLRAGAPQHSALAAASGRSARAGDAAPAPSSWSPAPGRPEIPRADDRVMY